MPALVRLGEGCEGNRCVQQSARCTTPPDGSRLFSLADQPEYKDTTNGVLSNYVERYLPDGRFMSPTSYNATAEKRTTHTRPKPLFSVAQLSELIQSKSWKLPAKSTLVKGTPTK